MIAVSGYGKLELAIRIPPPKPEDSPPHPEPPRFHLRFTPEGKSEETFELKGLFLWGTYESLLDAGDDPAVNLVDLSRAIEEPSSHETWGMARRILELEEEVRELRKGTTP